MSKTTIVLPTYNEIENLQIMVETLLRLSFVENLQILIVDDNSPDGTGELADKLSKVWPSRVQVLHRESKMGLGPAYIAGFKEALKSGSGYIIQMDCDFSHDPKYIEYMFRIMNEKNADLVIGSRYMHGGSVDKNWGLYRKLLSWGANSVYVRIVLGFNVHDATAGYRLWKRHTLEEIDLDSIKSNGYVFQVEMAYATHRHGLKIAEVPIYFPDRKRGSSKMKSGIVKEAALRVLQIRLRELKRQILKETPIKSRKV